MKKFLLLVFIACGNLLSAQSVLLGPTPKGGTDNIGLLAAYDTAGNMLASQDFFRRDIPGQYHAGFIMDNNGILYGGTYPSGGPATNFFKYDRASKRGEVVRTFGNMTDSLGYYLSFGYFQDDAGLIYGKTIGGGANGKGVLFSYDPATGNFRKILDCSTTVLNGSINEIVRHPDGEWYGTIQSGSSTYFFFKLTEGTFNYTELAPMHQSQRHLLINNGIVYIGGDGLFMVPSSGGWLQKYTKSTGLVTNVFNFSDGHPVYGSRMTGSCKGYGNKLYFSTENGVMGGAGTLLCYDITADTLTRIFLYPTASGAPYHGMNCLPNGKIIQSDQGAGKYWIHNTVTSTDSLFEMDYGQRFIENYFYDTIADKTYAISTMGPVMEVDHLSGRLKNIFIINNAVSANPSQGFVPGPGGKFYSMTTTEGLYNQGTVVEYDPVFGAINKICVGGYVSGNLVPAGGSDFYYFDSKGLRKYNSATNTSDTVRSWILPAPTTTPTLHTDGNLYGVCSTGGPVGNGYIYKFDLTTNVMTNLHDFNSAQGKYPSGELTFAPDGYFYGTTEDGGTSNKGVLYRFDPLVPGSFSMMISFGAYLGYQDPYGKQLLVGNYLLYGTISNIVYKYNIISAAISTVCNFASDTANGHQPAGGLILGSNGKIYGATNRGGTSYKGVIFQIDTLTNVYTNLESFTGTNGAFYNTTATNIKDWRFTEVPCPVPASPVLNAIGTINKCVGAGLTLYPSAFVMNASAYSWHKDGIALGILNDTLMISSLVVADSGYYVLRASNACGAFVFSDTVKVNLTCDLWPGDADVNNTVDNNDLLPIGLHYGLAGTPRAVVSNTWQAWSSTDWGVTQVNGQDVKHVDCNGDGAIDANDTLAVNLNFSLSHAFTPSANDERITNPDIYLVTTGSAYLPGDWIDAEVWLGSASVPVNNLYGIAFNIGYDASLVQPGSESLSYLPSWLGIPGTNALKLSKVDASAAVAYGAEVRTNHTNADGFGKIANFKFQLKNTISTSDSLNLEVAYYNAVDSVGNPIVFNTQNLTLHFSSVGIGELEENNNINVYPNPYHESTQLYYLLKEKSTVVIEVYNTIGQKIETLVSADQNAGEYKYSFSAKEKGYDAGIYFVKFNIDGKIIMRKIVEVK